MLAHKNDLISFSSTYFYFKRNLQSILVYTNDTNEELCTISVNDKRGVLTCISQNYMHDYKVRNTCVTE